MPRSASPSAFPREFEFLLRTQGLDGAPPKTLRFRLPSEATAMRHKLYSYFKAVRENGTPELRALVKNITLVKDTPYSLIVANTLHHPFRESIRSALGISDATPLPPSAEEILRAQESGLSAQALLVKRLAEMRAKRDAEKAPEK